MSATASLKIASFVCEKTMGFRVLLYLFAASVLLSPNISLAQGQFAINEAYNLANNLHAVAPDGSIFIYANHNDVERFLVKLDNNNQLLWSKKFHFADSLIAIPNEITGITGIAAMPDNGFVITGYAETGDLISNWNTVLIRFDKDGNIIWSNQYETMYSEEPGAILVKNGFIHLAGIGHSIQALPSVVFYAAISFTGEMEKFTRRFINIERAVRSLNILPSGMICVVNEAYFNNKNSISTIDLLDSEGNFIYYYSLAELSKNIYPSKVEVLGNDLIITGTAADELGYPYVFVLQAKSPQADTALPVMFYKLRGSRSHQIRASATTSDTALILCGVYDYGVLWQQNVFFSKLKFNKSNLDVRWNKVFGKSNFQDLRSLGIRPNGNVTGVGTIVHGPQGYNIFLAETNEKGIMACEEENFIISIVNNKVTLKGAKTASDTRNWMENKISVVLEPVPFTYYESFCPKLPPVAGFALSDTLICAGRSTSIDDTAKFAAGYNWIFEGTDTAEFHDSDPPELVFKEAGIFKLTQIVSNLYGSDTAERYIEVKPVPIADAGKDKKICIGSQITLSASGGVKYEWYADDELINDGNSANVTLAPSSSKNFTVVAFNELGCSDSDIVSVSTTYPPAEQYGYDTTICLGDSIELAVPAEEGLAYTWSNGKKGSSLSVKEAGIYRVIISNECFTKEAVFNVNLYDCSLRWDVPNAFTPNGDGLNDSFTIVGQNVREAELKIYTRWGQLLHSTTGAEVSWDGTFKGKPCQQDTYLYTIKIQGIKYEKQHGSGTLNLSR